MFRPGGSREKKLAHRLSYESKHGAIPRGLVVRHKCDTPSCVNPSHLETGTRKDNARDCCVRGRTGKTTLSEADVIGIRKAYVSGTSHKALCSRFAVSKTAMQDIIYGRSWKHLLRHPGVTLVDLQAARRRTPNAIINKETADIIRERVKSGEDRGAVGMEYGLKREAVRDIVRGKNWS